MDKLSKAIKKAEQKNAKKETALHKVLSSSAPKNNKYHVANKDSRTNVDGLIFASKKEMDRWFVLTMAERAGEIKNLQRQVVFNLQGEFMSIQYGSIRPINYIADFTYRNISFRKKLRGYDIVEDAKGVRTAEYLIKRKLFLFRHKNYLFFEV